MNAEIIKTLRVFAVDDSAILRQRLVEMLSELERVEVVGEAEGRDEAIAEITHLEPDVVILDIRLQQGNGIEVLTEIKKSKASPIVIMLTNYPHTQFREKCIQAGADYFFYKATEFSKVKEVVRDLASRSQI
jgi:DNA-binding NarL/FixJ family response regulator